MKCSSRI